MKTKNSSFEKITSLSNIPSLVDLDRFIPSKKTYEDLELKLESRTSLNFNENDENAQPKDHLKVNLRQELLKKEFFSQKNIGMYNPFIEKKLFSTDMLDNFEQFRHINEEPFKVLDAPLLQDDFYLNVLDWSSSNILGVGLGNTVYTWNLSTNVVNKLTEFDNDDSVASVCWNSNGKELTVGTVDGKVMIWDAVKSKYTYFLMLFFN